VTTTVGISGGSGAGKTTLTRLLASELGDENVSVLAFDSYYRDQRHLTLEERAAVNYDHPDALDHERFAADVARLRAGEAIEAPVYDFATHTRTDERRAVAAKPVVVIEGILLLTFPEVVESLDIAIFIDVPEAIRLERRVRRDVAERGRTAESAATQFAETVAPMHDAYVEPFRSRANMTVTVDDDLQHVAQDLSRRLQPS